MFLSFTGGKSSQKIKNSQIYKLVSIIVNPKFKTLIFDWSVIQNWIDFDAPILGTSLLS